MFSNRLRRLEDAATRMNATRCAACMDGTFPFPLNQDRFGESREASTPPDVALPYDDDRNCKTCGSAARDAVVLVRPG